MRFEALERMIEDGRLRAGLQTVGQLPERLNRLRSDSDQIRGRHELKRLFGALRLERHRHRAGNWPILPACI